MSAAGTARIGTPKLVMVGADQQAVGIGFVVAGMRIRRQRHRIAARRRAAHRGIDAKRRGVAAHHQLRYAVGDQ